MRECRVFRVSVVNCGSRLCLLWTGEAVRVGGPGEQHLFVVVVGTDVSRKMSWRDFFAAILDLLQNEA